MAAYVGPAQGRALTAYEMAGYRGTAASRRANASRLIAKDRVAKAIKQAQDALCSRLEAEGDEELALLGDVMRFNPQDLFDAKGQLLPISQLPRHVAIAIKAMRPTKHGLQLEFRDPLRAAEVRLRVFGRLRDTVRLDPGPRLEEIIAAANDRQERSTPAPSLDDPRAPLSHARRVGQQRKLHPGGAVSPCRNNMRD